MVFVFFLGLQPGDTKKRQVNWLVKSSFFTTYEPLKLCKSLLWCSGVSCLSEGIIRMLESEGQSVCVDMADNQSFTWEKNESFTIKQNKALVRMYWKRWPNIEPHDDIRKCLLWGVYRFLKIVTGYSCTSADCRWSVLGLRLLVSQLYISPWREERTKPLSTICTLVCRVAFEIGS